MTTTIKTRQSLARHAAVAWKAQYHDSRDGWRDFARGHARDIYDALRALDPPTPEAVNAIIGNESWTRCKCDHCGREVEAVAQMGEEPDYDSRTAYVCLDCLRTALAMFEAA